MLYRRFFDHIHWADSFWRGVYRRLGAVLAVGLTASPGLAQSESNPPQQAKKLDPQAVEILTSATEFLAAQDAMALDWFVSFDVVVDGREKITHMRSGGNLLQRGVGFYSYSETGDDTREYFFDGTTFLIADVEENAYVTASFTGGFDDLADKISAEYDMRLPIWQMMSARPRAELLDRADSAAYLGTTKLAGRPVHHLAFSDYDNDWQIWISTDPARPEVLMIVGTDPYAQGWPQYRAYFTNWDFDPDIAENAFSYIPDETAELMAWPKPSDVVQLGAGGN